MGWVAILTGILALVLALGAFATFRIFTREVGAVVDKMTVLATSVNGLEAALSAEVIRTRESADAAVALMAEWIQKMEAMEHGPAVETPSEAETRMAAFGRITAARNLFTSLEADSYRHSYEPKGVVNGG